MRIIISPAKKMRVEQELLSWKEHPIFLSFTQELKEYMYSLSYDELKQMWKCNDTIAAVNYERIRGMELQSELTPAILAYEGIQYQYMAPQVMTEDELNYIQDTLRILSGFYGILRPLDGVVPYRLEMQSKLTRFRTKDLYQFWNQELYSSLTKETNQILNLASKEYSKCIEKFLEESVQLVTCVFGELVDGKVKEKGTYAKMARGEMVRFLASKGAQSVDEAKAFTGLGFQYSDELSTETEYVFLREA